MEMYKIKFSKFNSVMGKIIMSETDTLYVLLTDEFGQKIPKEFQNISPENWAKYAFQNNKEYFITYYRNNKPFVIVDFGYTSIELAYYEERAGELFQYMRIWFGRGYIEKKTQKVEFVPFTNNKIFLCQVDIIGNLGKGLYFDSQKKKNNIRFEECVENDGKVEWIEQTGTADLSKNWFDAPKHYLDYEYLFEYQNLFNEIPKI
jgi:hypothetical protein